MTEERNVKFEIELKPKHFSRIKSTPALQNYEL